MEPLEELLEELVEDLPEGRLTPLEGRELPPDGRELPAAGERGADVRPGLLRTEVDGPLLGAPVAERLLPVDVGGRPLADQPEGGTITGPEGVVLPVIDLGATSCRPPTLEPDVVDPAGGDPYTVGR